MVKPKACLPDNSRVANNIIITNKSQVLRYIADELLDTDDNEETLTAGAEELLQFLQHDLAIAHKLNKLFFSPHKNLKNEFNLMLFPFVTAFVASIDRLEQDSERVLTKNRLFFFLNILMPKTKKELNTLLELWQADYSQMDAVISQACDYFEWSLSRFFNQYHQFSLASQKQPSFTSFTHHLEKALKSMNLENWVEGTTTSQLSHYLEQNVRPLLPQKESFFLKNYSPKKYLNTLSTSLDEERTSYQNKVKDHFEKHYNTYWLPLEQSWQVYYTTLQQRTGRIANYLNNLHSQVAS